MSHTLQPSIADMVLFFRKQSGLSQKQLALLAGVGKTVVFDIEKGKQSVRLNTLLKVLEVLNIQMTFQTPFPQPSPSQSTQATPSTQPNKHNENES